MQLKLILVLIFYVTLSSCINEVEFDSVSPIDVKAIGRVATLGEFYDARSNQFLHLSIFNETVPEKTITTRDDKYMNVDFMMSSSIDDKFKKLDISAGLKLSVLGGKLELSGSGKFLKDTKSSAKSAKASLMLSMTTKYEDIMLSDTIFQSIINYNILDSIEATHMVIGIQWGGNVFVSVEDSNSDDQDQQTVEGHLHAAMSLGVAQVSGQASVNISESDRKQMSKYTFQIFGDVAPDDDIPQTVIDALKFIKKAPKMIEDSNKGKGSAMKFKLMPLIVIKKLFKLNLEINKMVNEIDDSIVKKCIIMFDDLNKNEQKINDLYNEVMRYENYVTTDKVKKVKDFKNNFNIYQNELTKNYSDHLLKVRSGTETVDKLENVISDSMKHPLFNPDLTQFNWIKKEIPFINLIKNLNVTLLDKNIEIPQFVMENFEKDIYILFKGDDKFDDKIFGTFRNMLDNRTAYGPKSIFAAIKSDLLNENQFFDLNSNKSKISLYRRGERIIENFAIDNKPSLVSNPELWSYYNLQINFGKLVERHINDMNAILPIGFLYTQLPNQSSPQELWPNLKWSEVTKNYSGLFFRAEGGESLPFGQTQSANQSHISDVLFRGAYFDSWSYASQHVTNYGEYNYLNQEKWTEVNWNNTGTQYAARAVFDLKFYKTSGEVRPKNTAIKIFKRIQ